MKKFAMILTAVVLGGVVLLGIALALIGGAANEVAKDLEESETSSRVEAGDSAASGGEDKDYTWAKLDVARDEFGSFAGSLEVTNTTDTPSDVIVTVTAYDGEQTLGELNGSTRIKSGATTEVDLTSLDDFQKGATDYEVEVSGF